MRLLYSALFYLLTPLILARLLWRSAKAPEYRRRWRERFSLYDRTMPQAVVWLHAVSVGEAEAAFPLVKRLQSQFPSTKILVTTTTPTGSARVLSVLGQSVEHIYLPYDMPLVVRRFLSSFKPILAVIMETEIWPNLYHQCGVNKIPLYLVNARLSEKSARGYRRLPSLVRPALGSIKCIAAQTQEDAERYVAIGAKEGQVVAVGNIKFDLEIPAETISEGKSLKEKLFADRFVWLAASTHKGEEQILLESYKALKADIPQLLLLLVPRHPERFAEVGELCVQNKLGVVVRTSNKPCTTATDVYLADTMGELKMLYATADVAFVGGSMVPVGGHNVLEAAAIGAPVLFGPFMANFKDISSRILAYGAAVQCESAARLEAEIRWMSVDAEYREQLASNGKAFVQANTGALDKVCAMLSDEIAQRSP